MAKESIFGQKDLTILDTLSKEIEKALVNGYLSNNKAKYMSDSIQMIKSKERVNIFGRMVVFTKEIFK